MGTPAWAQQTSSIYYTGATDTDGKSSVTPGPYAGTSGGNQTVTLGAFAEQNNTATGNVFIGYRAGLQTTSGSNNTYIGGFAGESNTTGFSNAFVGYDAGGNNSSGQQNTAMGAYASYRRANAIVSQSNSLVLGSGVNVGIGTSAPNNKLEISQGSAGNSGLRFTNLTSATTPSVSTNQFLTVNASGDVVLALVGGSKGAFRTAAIDSS